MKNRATAQASLSTIHQLKGKWTEYKRGKRKEESVQYKTENERKGKKETEEEGWKGAETREARRGEGQHETEN